MNDNIKESAEEILSALKSIEFAAPENVPLHLSRIKEAAMDILNEEGKFKGFEIIDRETGKVVDYKFLTDETGYVISKESVTLSIKSDGSIWVSYDFSTDPHFEVIMSEPGIECPFHAEYELSKYEYEVRWL